MACGCRDLFDLALAIEREPEALRQAQFFLLRHSQVFMEQVRHPHPTLRAGFDAIATLDYTPSFEGCVEVVGRFLSGP